MRRRGTTTTLRGAILALALTPLLLLASTGSAAALPTISIEGSPIAVPGDRLTVLLDGANGYDGADAARFVVCGNADRNGVPLSVATAGYCDRTQFAPTVFNPVDGRDYRGDVRWRVDDIGVNQARCIDDGLIDCVVRVVFFDNDAVPSRIAELDTPVFPPGPTTPNIVAGNGSLIERFAQVDLGRIPVTLSEPTQLAVSVDWTLVDGSATSGSDFVAASGTLDFAPGTRTLEVPVELVDDDIREPWESLYVLLSNPINGVINGFDGLGGLTIFDDDYFSIETSLDTGDRMLDPGSVVDIEYRGLLPTEVLVISSCGNADSAGDPLTGAELDDSQRCHGLDDATSIGLNGIGRRTLVISGADHPVGTARYEWTEPIGDGDTTCVATALGEFSGDPCELRIAVIDVTTLTTFTTRVFNVAPRSPSLELTGPAVPIFDGTPIGLKLSGLTSDFSQRLAVCGNADASGTPLPIEERGLDNCYRSGGSTIFEGGTYNGQARARGNPFLIYQVDLVWNNEVVNDRGQRILCVQNGNFPCGIVLTNGLGPDARIDVVPEPLPLIEPGSATVTEGTRTVSLPVQLSAAVPRSVNVSWEVLPLTAGTDDVAPQTGRAFIRAGTTRTTVAIDITDDLIDEFDERFAVRFFDPDNAEIGGFFGLGIVDIIDDDDAPQVIPEFTEVQEGDPLGGSFTDAAVDLRLSGPSAKPVMVDVEILGSTATAGSDFTGGAGPATVTFAPGETLVTLPVQIIPDDLVEGDEGIVVRTSNWVNSQPGGYFGLGGVTILDDDADDCTNLVPGASLRGCVYAGDTLSLLDLTGADLSFANFDGARLIDVDLSDATLRGASFVDAIVAATDFADADATDTDFSDATIASSSLIGADFSRTSLDGATLVGGSLVNSNLTGATIRDARFLADNQFAANLAGVQWGENTLCSDNTLSGDHGNTCWRVPVQFRAGGATLNDNPVSLTNNRFFATFNPFPLFDPAELTDASRFGGPLNGVDSVLRFTFDSNDDGNIDTTYGFPVAGTPLNVGIDRYCAHAVLSSGDVVYGCNDLEVQAGPISPPASPPSSPPASGPASGMSVLAELVPFLTGPAGLVVTASGVGLLFMAGSNRATTAMVTDRRKDGEDDEHDGDGHARTDATT